MRAWLTVSGIVLLVALDVVLVYLAVDQSQSPSSARDGTSGPTVATPGSTGPSAGAGGPARSPASETPARSPDDDSSTGPASGEKQPWFSAVAADGTYARASREDCERGVVPSVTISRDLASITEPVDPPTGLAEILRVRAEEGGDVRLVGANQQCQVGTYTTSDAGQSWQRSAGAVGVWHRVLNDSVPRLHAPTGEVTTLCVPVGLSADDGGSVRVLCEQGTIVGTADSGKSWVKLGSLPGAAAIDYPNPSTGYAMAKQPGCPAAVMGTSDGGLNWTRLTCLGQQEPRSVAVAKDTIVALVGDERHVSTDGGATWRGR